jgi:hypothetical protein
VEQAVSFDAFWSRYPRHEAKKDALKAWTQLKPSDATIAAIHTALDWQIDSEQWTKQGGQYVPLPASWIRGRRWEDERRSGVDRRAPSWTFHCVHYPAEPHCKTATACLLKLKGKAS